MINISEVKELSTKKFAELGLPLFRYGNGFALNVTVDWEKVFAEMQKADYPEVIADEKVKICKLSEMDAEFIAKYAQKLIPAENKLLALHYSVNPDATVIIIPKNTVVEKPIQINSKINSSSSIEAESIMVIAEENSQATIIENNANLASEVHFKSQIVQLFLESRAQIHYCTVHNEKAGTHAFAVKRAEVLQDASITWLEAMIGEGVNQVQVRSHLRESGASAQQYQALVGSNAQQSDVNSEASHQHSNTKSMLLAKGIFADNSRGMHRGTIRVEKNALNCQGHQRSDMLLIGDEARCNAIPILEVENDDVSCSHGTTMGQLDEENLYYMLSRGLDEGSARNLLALAFLDPILQKIKDEELRERLSNIIGQKIK